MTQNQPGVIPVQAGIYGERNYNYRGTAQQKQEDFIKLE
jgi:hypothetical protein